jgi:hypothetical protein
MSNSWAREQADKQRRIFEEQAAFQKEVLHEDVASIKAKIESAVSAGSSQISVNSYHISKEILDLLRTDGVKLFTVAKNSYRINMVI